MWHEARKQEKLIRSQMIDSVKRNERRKQFYENVRKDPEQFMQIHGRKCQIHVDPVIWRAAEASNILRKWQGDPSVLIDRFDARSHLDLINEKLGPDQRTINCSEDLQCEYERYRILILNEFQKMSEASFLKQIAEKEFWPQDTLTHSSRLECEKKKQSKDKKAAVAFSYEDTQTLSGKGDSGESDEEEEEFVELEEFDLKFDVDGLDPERIRILNKFGMKYGIALDAFSKLLKMDRQEQDETHQLKEIEKAKLALAGRQAKAERALLKKKRALIVGKGCLNEEATTTLLSFVTQNRKEYVESSSSSSSEAEEKTEFITCFGDEHAYARNSQEDDFDDENTSAVHGPALPSEEFRRIFELKSRKSASPEDIRDGSSRRTGRFRTRTLLASPCRRSRTRSRERFPRRSYSRSGSREDEFRRGKDRERKGGRSRRRSRSIDGHRKDSKSRDSDKRRSRSSSYNRSKGSSGDSADRRNSASLTDRRSSLKRRRENSLSNGAASPDTKREPRSVLPSPSYDDGKMSPLQVHSSMSESEKERIEVENRRRRIRRTAKSYRERHVGGNVNASSDDEPDKRQVNAQRLKLQRQRALRRTAEELKEEERLKREEQSKERRKRDEFLQEESLQRRLRMRRERERWYRRRSRSRRGSNSNSG